MTAVETANLALIRAYLRALESGVVGEELAGFFAAHAVQVELPNKLNPNGGQSDLPTLLKRAEQGQKLLQAQRYEMRSSLAQGDRVAVEAFWSATLAVALGTLPAGSVMKAHFAMFFEMADGRIVSQRNYDCFEPW